MGFRIYSGLASIPPFNPDLDVQPAPSAVADLRLRLRECDAVIISSPEYAHGIPGALKNALDWIVGSGELYGKPVALFNASPRGTFAQASLTETLSVMGARLIAEACITLPLAAPRLDEMVGVLDSAIAAAIRDALAKLVNVVGVRCSDCSNAVWNQSSERT